MKNNNISVPQKTEDTGRLFLLLCISRFLSYLSSGMVSICMPILVFKITASPALAGLSMIIEWSPKVIAYMFGGGFASYIGEKRSSILAEGIRISGVVTIFLGYHSLSWLTLAAGAALVQIGGGLLNVVGDASVSKLSPPLERARAHSTLMRVIFTASLISAAVSALVAEKILLGLSIVGFIGSASTLLPVLSVVFSGDGSKEEEPKNALMSALKHIMKEPKLLTGTLIACSLSLPLTVGGSQLPFFAHALGNINISTQEIALLATMRNIVAIIALSMSRPFLNPEHHDDVFSFTMTSFLVITILFSLIPYATEGIVMNKVFLSALLILPLSLLSGVQSVWNSIWRHRRQTLLPENLLVAGTGLIISFEVLGFVLGAVLFSNFGKAPFQLFTFFVIPLILATAWTFASRGEHDSF